MTPPGTLEGRIALVTGAAGGIGSAVTEAFAESGASVLAIDREIGTIRESDQVAAQRTELTKADEVESAVATALDRFGRIDIVFNGAGISGRTLGDGPVETCTEEAWDLVLETNLKSVFLCCKYALPALRRSGGGAIVNLGSVLGLVGGDEDFDTHAYAASKAGIVGLTRAIAATYAPSGIRCNVICPGLIDTPMSRRAQADPRIRTRLRELQPLTCDFGRPEDVAAAALYLAGPDSRFVTGIVLPVDGGWTAR
jgi:NAD(P)-dependent dehydrogenase (short-subunit alcohol dehydrogenase family)